jgi:phospholipid/cholesterol/gamma-HCH transport system permease protein
VITREPIYTDTPSGAWQNFVRTLVVDLNEIGRAGSMTVQAAAGIPSLFMSQRKRRELARQMYMMGIKSLPVISVVGLFTGMVLGLQVGLELRRFNQEIFIGSGVMLAMLREMGPFMTGLIMAACVGSSMAAQLGTMTVNDEIAALEIMSIDPLRFLMTPRLAAMILMMPVLSFYACILGVVGGGLVGLTQLNVPWDQYMNMAMHFAGNRDLYVGLLKALLFGIIITGVSCYEGFTTRQGAVGVGRATRRSVITSFLLILILGYIVTRMFYDL